MFNTAFMRRDIPSANAEALLRLGHLRRALIVAALEAGCTGASRCARKRKKINFSTVFAGHTVGIKEIDDGVWLVSFMHYDLGYIDLEQRTLQPLDNPFGPRLSPMS
jgi:uncharacterized ferredoxin-like protein